MTKLIYLNFYKNVKNIHEVTCIIDKNPYYTFQTDKILHTFPDAKFICINRDYRANILSNRQSQKPYNSIKSVGYYAVIWNYYSEKLQQILSNIPNSSLLLKYEDLVENKEKRSRKNFYIFKYSFLRKSF
ncbi:MAG: sulfotransferase [Bacteroidetes bacterium]|nr:sulfotransferase [Bacteroidota bacterium]